MQPLEPHQLNALKALMIRMYQSTKIPLPYSLMVSPFITNFIEELDAGTGAMIVHKFLDLAEEIDGILVSGPLRLTAVIDVDKVE
jgi:hypothetical protein